MTDSITFNNDVEIEKLKIPLLTASNYYIWSRKVQLILLIKGLWGIVNGSETVPAEGSETFTISTTTGYCTLHDLTACT